MPELGLSKRRVAVGQLLSRIIVHYVQRETGYSLLELRADGIDLWLLHSDAIDDDGLVDSYRSMLTDDERAQEARFHTTQLRRQYVLTRALVRSTLSRYAPVAPESWQFVRNAYGRPELKGPGPWHGELSFNIAHTDGLIVCGVTRSSALGVDAESLTRDRSLLDIADRFFSPDEVTELRARQESTSVSRFFHYWTLKEAYIKAVGKGLSIPLDQFGFRLDGDRGIAVSFTPEIDDSPELWLFWLLQPSSRHVVALCAAAKGGTPQTVVVRKVVPTVVEEPVECRPLRWSARQGSQL